MTSERRVLLSAAPAIGFAAALFLAALSLLGVAQPLVQDAASGCALALACVFLALSGAAAGTSALRKIQSAERPD